MTRTFTDHGRFCIGLTGGIGCGKSTVANLFAEHGAGIIDTDTISHHLTQPGGKAIPKIRAAFGQAFISDEGSLNRIKMRETVFSDAVAKQKLEGILHPLILQQVKSELQRMQHKPYVVIVVPLLASSPVFRQLVQRVLVVDCPQLLQVERVKSRSGMSAQEILKIISQQTSREVLLGLADDVIYNDAGMDRLLEQTHLLHQKYSTLKNNI